MTEQEYLRTRDHELKPCPFCDMEAQLTDLFPHLIKVARRVGVGCTNDECIAFLTTDYATASQAIDEWNKRPS